MTIDIKHEKTMAIAWLVLAVINLVCTIVNIISKEWLEFIIFLIITIICLNLCLKHWQVAMMYCKRYYNKHDGGIGTPTPNTGEMVLTMEQAAKLTNFYNNDTRRANNQCSH